MGLPLFAATGDELIRALRRIGFTVADRRNDHVALERAYRRVVVPRARSLEPDELLALLHAAGVTYPELLEALDAPPEPLSSVRHRTIASSDGRERRPNRIRGG